MLHSEALNLLLDPLHLWVQSIEDLLLILNIRQIDKLRTVLFITDLIILPVTARSRQDQLLSFNTTDQLVSCI